MRASSAAAPDAAFPLQHPAGQLAASHTHSGPFGFANYPTYNSVAPSAETITDPAQVASLSNGPCELRGFAYGTDNLNTLRAMGALGIHGSPAEQPNQPYLRVAGGSGNG